MSRHTQITQLLLTFLCRDSQVKWHEICLSTPAAILEVLNAWENGVLSVEAVQVCPALISLLYIFFFHCLPVTGNEIS